MPDTPVDLAAIRARHAAGEQIQLSWSQAMARQAHADRGTLLDHIASVQVGIDALETKIAALAALQAFRARVEGRNA